MLQDFGPFGGGFFVPLYWHFENHNKSIISFQFIWEKAEMSAA